MIEILLTVIPRRIGVYYEPFIGGGSMFFALEEEGKLREGAVLSDSITQLVHAYLSVRDAPKELIGLLEEHQEKHSKDHFRDVRNDYNRGVSPDKLRNAANLIYLNRVSFNHLYRVNARGGYNAPFGNYNRPDVVRAGLLEKCSEALQGAKLGCSDARSIDPGPGDLVFLDPPYLPREQASNFGSYTATKFQESDHVETARKMRQWADKGVFVVACNSDTPETRKIYEGFKLFSHNVYRSIGARTNSRGPARELLITSYDWR